MNFRSSVILSAMCCITPACLASYAPRGPKNLGNQVDDLGFRHYRGPYNGVHLTALEAA